MSDAFVALGAMLLGAAVAWYYGATLLRAEDWYRELERDSSNADVNGRPRVTVGGRVQRSRVVPVLLGTAATVLIVIGLAL